MENAGEFLACGLGSNPARKIRSWSNRLWWRTTSTQFVQTRSDLGICTCHQIDAADALHLHGNWREISR
jgi:hypothetical protein